MPLLNSLATPYAEALLQVTEARGESETVADQCKQLLAIWNNSEDFRDAMVSPVLEPDAKKKALKALVGEDVTPSVFNLLKVLADRQRLIAFDAVMLRYLELYREQQGITLAQAEAEANRTKEESRRAIAAERESARTQLKGQVDQLSTTIINRLLAA